MYFPRGVIHQARSPEDVHSLHLTISTSYQYDCKVYIDVCIDLHRNTWFDYLSIAVPRALEIALTDSVLLRRNLPRDYMNFMGVVYSERDDDVRRAAFQSHVSTLLREVWKLLKYC